MVPRSQGQSKVAGAFPSDIVVTRRGHIYLLCVFSIHTIMQGKELLLYKLQITQN